MKTVGACGLNTGKKTFLYSINMESIRTEDDRKLKAISLKRTEKKYDKVVRKTWSNMK